MLGLAGSVAAAIASLMLGQAGVSPPPSDPVQLAAGLNSAQQVIDSPSSSVATLTRVGRFVQLATGVLRKQSPSARRETLARLDDPAAATIRADLAAAAALSQIPGPQIKSLPPWRIIQPPAPNTLLGYFKAAQAQFGVPWEYLAAIEMIETDFGRADGLSTAGAEGPMQFIPSTWAAYGRGNVRSPRDAIFGAARYLVASGAPGDMAGAIYHYNPSGFYVSAVQTYANRMRSDPRAYYGYYFWQVIFGDVHGTYILPLGFPKVPAIPLR
jgi:hypothetical protein